MLLRALLSAAPARGELDRAALAVHSTMVEHGFVCTGASEPPATPEAVVAAGGDGSVSLQLVPAGWNAQPDSYTFGYAHPQRGASESFTVKALAINDSLAVHAASSVPGAELLTVTLHVPKDVADTDLPAVVARAHDWQEKIAASIALRLLSRQNSTKRLGVALEQELRAAAGTKRPAPEEQRRDAVEEAERRRREEEMDMRRLAPPRPGFGDGYRDPFSPGFFGDDVRPQLLWSPDSPFTGGLLGPRHPAWGQAVPGRTGGSMVPRFDPILPGHGEPDPDHLRVGPGGFSPEGFPAFQGGATGGRHDPRRFDPDGMFMM